MNRFRRPRASSRATQNEDEAQSASAGQSATSLVTENTMRIYVRYRNGSKIVIPIAATSTVSQLHAEAAKRGATMMLGMPCTIDSTALRVSGFDGAILWGEDKILDVLDLTENYTFWLVSSVASDDQSPSSPSPEMEEPVTSVATSWVDLESGRSPPSLGSPQPEEQSTHSRQPSMISSTRSGPSNIYVRWITAERALKDSSRLRSIAADTNPINSHITISGLKNIAFDRLYSIGVSNGEMPPNTTAELFLSSCYLSPNSSMSATLASLGLKGSRNDPLDVFVVPTRNLSSKLQDTWAFTSSDRGVAAFLTCLKLYLKKTTVTNVDNTLEVLWERTHFPPAVIAFKQLYESGLRSFPCAVFASCFREACLQVIPPWISSRPDTVLETSRQVFSWLYALHSESSSQFGGAQSLVHGVELREVRNHDDAIRPGRFSHDELVDVPSLDQSDKNGPSQSGILLRRVLVSKERLDGVTPRTLALALQGAYEEPCNYYFSLPPSAGRFRNHRRVSMLHLAEFDNVLQTTNQDEIFKMVGPFQLTQYPSASLPIITLDREGYVSLYDQRDEECGDKHFFTTNAINEEEKMPASEPGQFLLQKLFPIIMQRKKDGTWEPDAWVEDGVNGIERQPDEVIVICIDRSSSMGTELADGWLEGNGGSTPNAAFNRLSEVKEVFKHLVTRLNAYRLNIHLGLVTFANQRDLQVNRSITQIAMNVSDDLNHHVNASGSTALWDALVKSKDMLATYKSKYLEAKLRIIALTDGENNNSEFTAPYVCSELYDNNIVLDAIVIGTSSTADLFKMAKHTGGYAFAPKSRTAFFQIFLLETFIDIRTRPDIVKIPIVNYASSMPKPADMQDIYSFPPCRPHANQDDNFIALQDAARFLTAMSNRVSRTRSVVSSSRSNTWSDSTVSGTGSQSSGVASGSGRILLNQVKVMIDNPHPYMDVYVSESNMGFWKVVMQGPPSSPYERGIFLIYIELGDDFPRRAPSVRFITPILHPNVSKHGRICHPIFDREWAPTIRVHEMLGHIWSILTHLEARDAIDPLFTLRFFTDPETGKKEVERYIARFALRSRELHKYDIVGATSSSVLSYASSVSSPPSAGRTHPMSTVNTRPSAGGHPYHTSGGSNLFTLPVGRAASLHSVRSSNASTVTPPPPGTPCPGGIGGPPPLMAPTPRANMGTGPGAPVGLGAGNRDSVATTTSSGLSRSRRRSFFARFATDVHSHSRSAPSTGSRAGGGVGAGAGGPDGN